MYIYLFLLLLVILSLTKTYIDVTLHRMNQDDQIIIKIMFLFKLIKIKFKIPYIDLIINKRMQPSAKVKSEIDTTKDKELNEDKSILGIGRLKKIYDKSVRLFEVYKDVMLSLLSRIKIESFKWYTEVGTGDAALTAIIIGFIWNVKGNAAALLFSKTGTDPIDISAKPNYNKVVFDIDFNCIISMRIANIIIAGIKILYVYVMYKIWGKGGEFYERSSNPRTNENYNG